jgi:hypothetical protein
MQRCIIGVLVKRVMTGSVLDMSLKRGIQVLPEAESRAVLAISFI